jgi:hypothetical protein
MLTQMARLSIDVEGRYASDRELRFIEEYMDSFEVRLSAYEKIRYNEVQILQRWQEDQRVCNAKVFHMNGQDVTEICRRDMTSMLRCSASAMLFDDIDRLQDSLLVWYKTIVKSFGFSKSAFVSYQVIQEIVKSYLTEEEMAAIAPILQLDHAVLSAA